MSRKLVACTEQSTAGMGSADRVCCCMEKSVLGVAKLFTRWLGIPNHRGLLKGYVFSGWFVWGFHYSPAPGLPTHKAIPAFFWPKKKKKRVGETSTF